MHAALKAYASTARTGLDSRSLEAAVLTRCAIDLQRASAALPQDRDALLDALERNRKLWQILFYELSEPDSPLPPEIRRNLLIMAAFTFKRTMEICDAGEAAPLQKLLQPLIDINRELAAGLERRAA
jgi:flagellar protein FlaF